MTQFDFFIFKNVVVGFLSAHLQALAELLQAPAELHSVLSKLLAARLA